MINRPSNREVMQCAPPAGMGSRMLGPDTPPIPFTPLSISNLRLWLDVQNAGSVHLTTGKCSQLDDVSGNALHFVQATAGKRLTYNATGINGHPTLTASSADPDSMTMTNHVFSFPDGAWSNLVLTGTAAAFTWFLVWKYTGSTVSAGGDPEHGLPNLVGDQHSSGPWQGVCGGVISGDASKVDITTFAWNGGQYTEVTPTAEPKSAAHYSTHAFDDSSGLLRVGLEQHALTTTPQGGAGLSSNTGALPVCITSSNRGSTPAWDGEFGEWIAYSDLLSPTNILKVQQYLAAKWGI
jgi:hypothetical protein